MREAIGGTWIFSIVIVFIVLFSGYLAISVNYSKAFRVKNQIVTIIEQHEGLNTDAEDEITEYLNGVGYAVYGKCDTSGASGEREYGRESNTAGSGYKYCITKRVSNDSSSLKRTYYKVKVWFRLDLPIFGSLFTFPITGETKGIYYANDTI